MMKKLSIFLTIFIFLSVCFTLDISAKEKLAQTGMQFLSVGADSRASGMGEAVSTLEMGSGSLFFNPAGMANMWKRTDFTFSRVEWIADMSINAVSGAINIKGGKYGVFGFSVVSIDYGTVEGTMVWPNSDGYIDTENFSPSALSIGIGYARALSDKFSVGGQMKFLNEYLGESVIQSSTVSYKKKKNLADALAFDFGTLFKTGFKSLKIGMSVRNFSNEIEYEEEGFQLPLTFKIGLSMNLMDFMNNEELQRKHSLFFALDASHPRSHSEQMNIGLEYSFMNFVFLRTGYMSNNDEYGMCYGFGLTKSGITFDYSYTPFGVFDEVQRFTIRFSF